LKTPVKMKNKVCEKDCAEIYERLKSYDRTKKLKLERERKEQELKEKKMCMHRKKPSNP